MTWQNALNSLQAHPAHARYVELCSDDNPNEWQRQAYRQTVMRMANSPQADIARLDAAYRAVGGAPVRGGCCGG